MKILKVSISKFKSLEDFESNIEGKNVFVVGENGVGKSTFLQAIDIALGKKKKLPTGENGEWEVWADKDGREWKFRVRMKDGKPTVETTSPEGVRDVRVSALKQVTGAVDFDIDEFVSLSETEAGRKKQVNIYKSLLDQEIQDFVKNHELKIDGHYRDREDTNRDIKRLKGAVKDHPLYGQRLGDQKKIDASQIREQIIEASKTNEKVEKVQNGVEERTREITEVEAEILRLQEKHGKLVEEKEKGEAWLKSNEKIDISGLSDELEKAETHNKRVSDLESLEQKQREIEKLEDESGEMTALIDSCRQAVQDCIRDCDLPVEGLAFDEDRLMYNGVPVEVGSLSTSEIMELGVRMKIVENPELPLIIQRGESLGSERLKTILDIAKKYNMQVLTEEVRRGEENLKIEFIAEDEVEQKK